MNNTDSQNEARIRWRCRRGLLELDMVLKKVMDDSYSSFNAEERKVFHELLDLADNDILQYMHDPESCPHAEIRNLLENVFVNFPVENV